MIYSYTGLSCYEVCPRQFHERFVLRTPMPAATPEQQAGVLLHEAIQRRVQDRKGLPPELAKAEPIVQSFERRGAPIVERKLAVTHKLEPCDFWHDQALLRGVVDLMLPAGDLVVVGDWKTGKVREDDFQLMIFAILILVNFEPIETVHAFNIWLREGRPGQTYTWARAQLPVMLARLFERIDRIEQSAQADYWPERPSPLCGWCGVLACAHNKRKA